MAPTRLDAPSSDSTVRVRMIDTTAIITIVSESFIKPVIPGHDIINCTDVAFLIENRQLGRRVLFDAGVRKDYWNLPPLIQKRLGDIIPGLRVEKDVSEILEEHNVQLDSIGSIIWSHHHWDHVGRPELFPPSTSITVGPGFKSSPNFLPGWPKKQDSSVSASDFEGRELVEISFSTDSPTIGGFRAHDYFGDGSFYLLDTPGHAVGHMCGLARTTPSSTSGADSSTFILLGGDICHFTGVIRPTPTYPLPEPIPSGVLDQDSYIPTPCPCSFFTDHHPQLQSTNESEATTQTPRKGRETPWYIVSDHPRSAYIDPPTARKSVGTLTQKFEEKDNVLICLAHDPSMLRSGVVPTLNDQPDEDMNTWYEKGWKANPTVRWGWLNELPRGGKRGRESLVEGLWRDGKVWGDGRESLANKTSSA